MEHLWDEEEEEEKNVINPLRGNKRLFDCASRTKVAANIVASPAMCTAHPLALGGSDRTARD
jgi:hypothetical protein